MEIRGEKAEGKFTEGQTEALRKAVRLVLEGKCDSARQVLQEMFEPAAAKNYLDKIVQSSPLR